MKSKFLVVFLCISVLLGVGFYPLLAQQAGPQSSGPSGGGFAPMVTPQQGLGQPQWGQVPNPYQVGPTYNQPTTTPSQGATSLKGSGSSQPALGSQDSIRQQSPQNTTSSQASMSSQPQPVTANVEPPSPIEIAFRDPSVLRTPASMGESPDSLRQFGYSLFASNVSTFAPVEDVPVGPDYVLGPGDNLAVNVWGAMDGALVQAVDRNGQIVLPSSGPMRVWGLTFSQAERLIREQLSRSYRGFQTSITMGRLRTIRVYVMGEVRQPGSFTLSSLSTVTNALFSGGGPLKLGSLRNIEIKRNHHSVGTLDLYDFLLRGDKTRDFRLESGDTIFIPPIGSIAAIAGEVKRPAIYELKGPTRVNDLIEMAGGLTPQSYLKRVQVIRAKPNAEREVVDLDLTTLQANGDSPVDIEIRNGDLVKIYPTDPRIYNTISLAGVVKYPGEYEIKPNMRLSQLLPQGSILPEAYLNGVEVIRFKEDLTTEVISADLKKAWAGDQAQDIVLHPRDLITVRSEFQGHKEVTLAGEVKLTGRYTIKPGERLSSVIKRAGGFSERAFLKGTVFTRRSVQEIEQKRLEEFMRQQEERILAEKASASSGFQSISTSQATIDFNETQRREQLKVVASRVTLGRIVVHLDDLEKFAGSPSDLILENGDRLNVPQIPAEVLVLGSVKQPTAIIYSEGEDIQYYLNRAGGFTEAAEAKEMYLLKADGSALTGFLRLRNVEVGDAIIVPPKSQERTDWSWLKDLATIAGQAALGLAAIKSIF